MLIDEVIYNKVLYYPDSNSKLKIIKGKVSTKNIPDMGHGRPIDFSHTKMYLLTYVSNVEGLFSLHSL